MKTKLFSKKKVVSWALAAATPLTFVAPAFMSKTFYASAADASTQNIVTTVEAPTAGATLKFTGYTANYKTSEAILIGDKKGYLLPKPDQNITPVVKKTNGKLLSGAVFTSGENYYLDASIATAGSYVVTYSVTSGEVTTSKSFDITITDAYTASVTLNTNSKYILPNIAILGETIKIGIPSATFDGDSIGDLTADNIKLRDGKGNDVELIRGKNGEDDADFFYYQFAQDDKDAVGTYTISYEGNLTVDGIDYKLTPVKQTFTVAEKRDATTLSYSTGSMSISSIDLKVGKESTLPKPTVVNKAGETVSNVYTEITVTDVNALADDPEKTIVVSDFKFMPTKASTYTFDYKTVDFAGNEVSINLGRLEANYSANETIKLYVTDDYSVAAEDVEDIDIAELVDQKSRVPTKLFKRVADDTLTIKLPALFAVSDGKVSSFEKLTLSRTIEDLNNADKEAVDVESESVKINNEAEFEINFADWTKNDDNEYRFKINYTAAFMDVDGDNTSKTESFTFVVKEVAGEITAPTVTVTPPELPSSVRVGKEISFGSPTVSDILDGVTVDSNPTIAVSYYFGSDDSTAKTLNKNSSGKYVIDTTGATDSIVTVKFDVWDDYTYQTGGTAKSASQTVALEAVESDTNAPTITTEATTRESGVITLTNVVATDKDKDNNDSVVSVTAYVTNSKGDVIDTIYETSTTAVKAAINDRTYTPAAADTYTVTYVAVDASNNYTVYAESFEVHITTGYNVFIDQISAQEYGATIDLLSKIHLSDSTTNKSVASLEKANVFFTNTDFSGDNEASDIAAFRSANGIGDSGEYAIIYVGGNGARFDAANATYGELVALEGEVNIRAWAVKDNIVSAGSNLVSFTTSDSTSPTFSIDNENFADSHYDWNDTTQKASFDLPWFDSLNDAGVGVDENTMKVTWSFENSSSTNTITYQQYLDAQISVGDKVTQNTKFEKSVSTAVGALEVVESGATDGQINKVDVTGISVNVGDYVIKYFTYSKAADGAITVTADNIDGISANRENNPLHITVNKQGKITVKYSVSDKAGNTKESASYIIHIGDTVAPVIDASSLDTATTAPTTAKDGAKITIDLDKIAISKDEIDVSSDNFSITVKKDGSEVSYTKAEGTNMIEVDASEAGEYVFTFQATDAAGNKSATATKTVNVESVKPKTSSSTTVLGTILIVIALIILGLAIFFFAKPSKSNAKPAAPKVNKPKSDEDKKAE